MTGDAARADSGYDVCLPQCAGMSLGWTVLEGRHDAAVEEADLIVK
jgi:hypothetical protein